MPTPYAEVVFECDPTGCEKALKTLCAKTGIVTDRFFFSEKLGIQGESRVHRVLETLRLAGNETHILIPSEAWPTIRTSRKELDEQGAAIVSAREVVETGFAFHFTTYNREHGAKIQDIVRSDVPGVRLENFESTIDDQPHEKDFTGRYTASHDYVFSGSGRFVGPVESLIAIHRLAESEPLLELSEIGIVLGRDLLDDRSAS